MRSLKRWSRNSKRLKTRKRHLNRSGTWCTFLEIQEFTSITDSLSCVVLALAHYYIASQWYRKQLEELNQHIQEETDKVIEELSGVEPAVQEAKTAVRSIKKPHLVEIRSMGNPPAGIKCLSTFPFILLHFYNRNTFSSSGVKLCLESICLLLGEQTTDWKSIRQIIIRDNFIATIINFSTDDISDHTRKLMKDK